MKESPREDDEKKPFRMSGRAWQQDGIDYFAFPPKK